MTWSFAGPGVIHFGWGACGEAAAHLPGQASRWLLVHGRTPDRADPMRRALEAAGDSVTSVACAGEPTLAFVETTLRVAQEARIEAVVAVGGGSVLDAGKALAALVPQPGSILDYLEVVGRGLPLDAAPLPFAALPTTAGTGSEATRNAVITVPSAGVKASLRDARMLPRWAFVDPALTLDLPPDLTAATGLDALTQLIEPFLSPAATPMTDALCRDGIPRSARSLEEACHDGRNRAAREDLALASLYGGMALANAKLGAVHGLAAPLGGRLSAPHGAVCARLLPEVLEQTWIQRSRAADPERLEARFRELASLLGWAPTVEGTLDAMRSLVARLPVAGLSQFGLTEDHQSAIAIQAAASRSMAGAPVAFSPQELEAILRCAQ